MKRVAIIQSCYIPWRGFFDLISRCDEYLIYDQVAYRTGHWHNRNRIKTAQGLLWLTIPARPHLGQPIEEVEVKPGWAGKHWRSIEQSYARSLAFKAEAPRLQSLYERADRETRLSAINELFLCDIAQWLGLSTRISRDRDYAIEGTRNERVLSACLAMGASHYLSGPSARAYLDPEMFAEKGVSVEWMSYGDYADYPQPHGDFAPEVSVIDLLLNAGGANARRLARAARVDAQTREPTLING